MAIWIKSDGVIQTLVPTHGSKALTESEIRRHVGGVYEQIPLAGGKVLFDGKNKKKGPNRAATKYARQHGWQGEGELTGDVVICEAGEVVAAA